MKKKKIELSIKILFFVISIYIFLYFIINLKNTNFAYYFQIMFWIILAIFCYQKIGYVKNRKILKKDTTQIIIISTLLYLILTYLLGLVVGFASTPIKLKFLTIISNILPLIILILSQEYVRYIIINKIKDHKIYLILLTMIFIINDAIVYSSIYNFGNYNDIFEYVGLFIIGGIFNNILYTYIAYHVGQEPNIFYRIIMECYIYLVPFVPNPGIYLNTLCHIILPVIVIVLLTKLYEKEEKIIVKRPKYSWIYSLIIILFIALQMCLISGVFNYQILAVASNSMNPVFYRGDAVIIKKIKSEENLEDILKINQVIAFKSDSHIFIHRIVKVRKEGKTYYYTTKGDNNTIDDEGEITSNDIIGVVKYITPIIGYPTVWLNEIFE